MPHAWLRAFPAAQSGQTLIELLFTLALVATIAGMAVPLMSDVIDAHRTAAAARYLAGRVSLARLEAVKRSTNVGLKFEPVDRDFSFATYIDGNGNGVRNADIRSGIDPQLMPPQRLRDHFAGVRFGLMSGIPDVDGGRAADEEGVRIGVSGILSLGANGTATAGTLYLHGRRRQYAVRVLGVTARTRVLYYDPGARKWVSR
jgi:type II secretory pathway pseudopilin PulG